LAIVAGSDEAVREFLWTLQDLAQFLRIKNLGSVRHMLVDGRITEADGWIKIGRLNRFIKRVVIARYEAGLFGRGLDQDGEPARTSERRIRSIN
jgi:hypothetical protein